MEQLVIPAWAVFLIIFFGSGLVGWLVWLTLRTLENKSEIALNTAADKTVSIELEKVYKAIEEQSRISNEKFDKMENSMEHRFEKIDNKIDLFFGNILNHVMTKS